MNFWRKPAGFMRNLRGRPWPINRRYSQSQTEPSPGIYDRQLENWNEFYPRDYEARYHGLCKLVDVYDEGIKIAGIKSQSQSTLESDLSLSEEQSRVLEMIKTGTNLYFTGKAGTGKTRIIRAFVEWAKSQRRQAPTGIAASLIEGQTIHSFAGITPRLDPVKLTAELNVLMKKYPKESADWDAMIKATRKEKLLLNLPPQVMNKVTQENFTMTRTIVIDEISMVNPAILDLLDTMARFYSVKSRSRVFGGIQIILCGDFLQLPPVIKEILPLGVKPLEQDMPQSTVSSMFSSQSNLIQLLHPEKNADGYLGRHCSKSEFVFQSRLWKRLIKVGMKQIQLTQSHRHGDKVFVALLDDIRHGINSTALIQTLDQCYGTVWDDSILPTRLSAYRKAVDLYNEIELGRLKTPLREFSASDSAQFTYQADVPEDVWALATQYSSDLMDAQFRDFQAPKHLKLKVGAQVILLKNIRTTSGLVNGSRGVVTAFFKTFDPFLRKESYLPVVQFIDGRSFVIGYHGFETSCRSPYDSTKPLRIWRYQVPLKLGWALTIHKSQGLTLDRVEIDLPDAFTPGLAYVAFSRAKGLDGLRLKTFSESSMFVSAHAKSFHLSLPTLS